MTEQTPICEPAVQRDEPEEPPHIPMAGAAADFHGHALVHRLFHEQLLEHMHDGVVFFDADLRICRWNRALERLTGIAASRVEQQPWDPAILQMRDENYKPIFREACPVVEAVRSAASNHRRLYIADASQDKISVDAHITPVVDALGRVHGATLLLQDASSRVSLEERVQRLHEKVRQDGLTGVANRAEFDRVHPEWVELHLAQGTPYSMILCDLDHFKKVNDTYGHQAGDDALLTFTSLLSRACRGSDVIARYGGEEFVVLCPDCHSASAAVRAEAVRETLAAERQPMLDGKCITASFGVTELQATDTPETMLRRADRALLQAKNDGRNVVVQLTAAIDNAAARRPRSRWFGWLQRKPGQLLLSRKVITAVPVKLALEKLRGFVADHKAHIAEIAGNRVTLQSRISAEPRLALLIEMEFREVHWDAFGATETGAPHTVVHVTIRPQRQRDRRRGDADRLARHLLADLKSYLMAQDYDRLGK